MERIIVSILIINTIASLIYAISAVSKGQKTMIVGILYLFHSPMDFTNSGQGGL